MPGANLVNRTDKLFYRTVTFDGSAGGGQVGTAVAVATISGTVLLKQLVIRCSASLTGATATVQLGMANDLDGLIASTTATDILVNRYWQTSTPTIAIGAAIVNKAIDTNIIITPGTAAVASGSIEVSAIWMPLNGSGNMST